MGGWLECVGARLFGSQTLQRVDLARRRIYGVGGNVDGAGKRGDARVETGGEGCVQGVSSKLEKFLENV